MGPLSALDTVPLRSAQHAITWGRDDFGLTVGLSGSQPIFMLTFRHSVGASLPHRHLQYLIHILNKIARGLIHTSYSLLPF